MSTATTERPSFPAHSPLRGELNAQVDEYFARTGLSRDGGPWMWLKSATIILWAVASWALLLFWASTWWAAIPLSISLGLALAGMGFSVMHDGGHGAYSHSNRTLNRAAAAVLDLMGGSSYFWNQKHNVLHHTYTNIDGVDTDIELRPFFRLAASQRRYWFHRFQWFYWVPLFVFFTTKWLLVDDFVNLATGRLGAFPVTRPRGWDLVLLLAGKAFMLCWLFIVPLMVVPWAPYLVCYVLMSTVWGLTLGLVFQLAHAMDGVTFVERGQPVSDPWVEHQLATTVDFARGSRVLTWYLGGLNFQVEHHLFPRISHLHYPALATILRTVCAKHGITPHEYPTVRSALGAHLRHLWRMGHPVREPQVAVAA